MRFMVCARNRYDGAISLVSEASFPNRREAVEAIVASVEIGSLLASDVFLVDLDGATPVALVPVTGIDDLDAPLAPEADEPLTEALFSPAELDSANDELDEGSHRSEDPAAVQIRLVEIDIEAWSCEDCIYVTTCEKSGMLRPVDCGSFQWRA